MSSSTKRACDACHRRKVKCCSRRPCTNCSQAGLSCTYNAIPQKKGPKGSRAKVISELRQRQKQSQLAMEMQNRFMGIDGVPISYSRTPGLLTPETIRSCIDFFFAHLYPTMPILQRDQLHQISMTIHDSVEAYCLISSLCAFMMIQPGMKPPAGERNGEDGRSEGIAFGTRLLEETLRVRKGLDYVENPTHFTVIISFFLFACYFGLDKHNPAWFHLREATTLAQIIGLQQESSYLTGDPRDASRRRRLFWLLFVTERAYALQRHRPLSLHSTIEMAPVDEDPSETVVLSGFNHMVNLYRPLDDMFVGLWNKARADCSTPWLAQLQKQIACSLPATLTCTESQAADLRTSQQWLRTMVWQLSITNGYLSSSSSEDSMTFKYPIDIARDLITFTGQLSRQAMEVHGVGLIEKLFDVACTLTDVMSCVPISSDGLQLGPRDYLNEVLALVSTLRGGESRYLPLLLAKINDTFPVLSAPIPEPVPLEPIGDRVEEIFESSPSADSQTYDSPPLQPATLAVPTTVGIPEYPTMVTGQAYPSMSAELPYAGQTTTANVPPIFPIMGTETYGI
ncbi:hypothetical protein L228DRAFT_265572 [Xylona heveae TC161]|uniref:Zn(2)-C6 fungal-type domain-containing protein n=1 Tax=Xylona heveae (strain CBS 132557 / TC161) TaxID=1328760 RepID=A0A165IM13_XYLHT|nr:hypothetical protein L228DRAFT_265572 [Xylona heveae TC161]KZF25090.1 hypothetical protein L228DRAFT_265572 [Xylona heveae TC161]